MKVNTNYYNEIADGYNELHQSEQEQKLKLVKQYIQPRNNEKLLDVGCGTGISTQFNCECYGIDPSNKLLKIARKDYPQKNKTFVQASAESIPFKDSYFDYVISLTAAQNFQDLSKAVSEIKRVAKPSAKIVVSILKKSDKEKISKLCKLLYNFKEIEQDKDIIFVKV